MDRYQLAMLGSWTAERGIQGRKRLQKVVFFLQAAGCPLGCRFTLHHYGPYSRDVADVCDEMVMAGLLEEQVSPNAAGAQYGYKLTALTKQLLETLAQQDSGRAEALAPFRNLAGRLLNEDLWRLELGSTILYFYKQSGDWTLAVDQACEFKKAAKENPATQAATQLAQEVANTLPASA
jgi:uncharacterized protein YwgA